jgi:hypothetical protein
MNQVLRLNEAPEVPMSACYVDPNTSKLECYASAQRRAKEGTDLSGGIFKRGVQGRRREEMIDYLNEHGLEMFQQNFPEVESKFNKYAYDVGTRYQPKHNPRIAGMTKGEVIDRLRQGADPTDLMRENINLDIKQVKNSPWSLSDVVYRPTGAAYTKYQPVPAGVGVRGGVTSTGDLYFHPDIMDALYEAAPDNPFVFINANYHQPDLQGLMGHPLQGRTMINNTVSGYFSPLEMFNRVRMADAYKEAGWNSVLRYVNSDPKLFPETDFYNRYLQPLRESTDFLIMGQPLHTAGGSPTYSGAASGIPSCCESPAPGGLMRTCANCEGGDALAPQFLDRWGVKEGGGDRVLPGMPTFVEDARSRKPFDFPEK